MSHHHIRNDFNGDAFWAGISAFLFMLFGALTLQVSVIQQFDLPDAQARSWIVITWLSAGVVSLAFILRYRQPLAIGWTIPGLVYMGSLSGRFSFEEFVGANLVAGAVILALGVSGLGSRVIHFVPLPILMGMFAASIVGFITGAAEATASDAMLVGPMVVAYLVARAWNNPRVPPVGVAVIAGALLVAVLGKAGTPVVEGGLPQLATPGVSLSLEAVVTVSIPMVILVIGLGNVQGLGFLIAQGYRVPSNGITAAVGAMSIVNALLGGHPAAMTRVSSGILGGPSAGPLEKRYWGAMVTMILATGVALVTGPLLAVVAVLPPAYIVTVAGLAILASFEDALGRAFAGSLRSGAAIAFGVTLSTFTVAGIPSAFWALLAGITASLLLEREELLKQWRDAIQRTRSERAIPRAALGQGVEVATPQPAGSAG